MTTSEELNQDEFPVNEVPTEIQEFQTTPPRSKRNLKGLVNFLGGALIALLLVLCAIAGLSAWALNGADAEKQALAQKLDSAAVQMTSEAQTMQDVKAALDRAMQVDVNGTAQAVAAEAVAAAVAGEQTRVAALPTATLSLPSGEAPVELAVAQSWQSVFQDAFDNNDNLWRKRNGYVNASAQGGELQLLMDCINLEGSCRGMTVAGKSLPGENFYLHYQVKLGTLPSGWAHVLGIRWQEPVGYLLKIDRAGKLVLVLVANGEETLLQEAAIADFNADTTHEIGVLAQGDFLRIFVDGNEILQAHDATFKSGMLLPGVEAPAVGNSTILLDNWAIQLP